LGGGGGERRKKRGCGLNTLKAFLLCLHGSEEEREDKGIGKIGILQIRQKRGRGEGKR